MSPHAKERLWQGFLTVSLFIDQTINQWIKKKQSTDWAANNDSSPAWVHFTMMDLSNTLLSLFVEARDDGRQQTVFVSLSRNIMFLRLLILLCWQVCAGIWSLASVPGEHVLLEWLEKHVSSLHLVEPDRQGTYVCVLGLVINTWALKLPLLPGNEGTSLQGSGKIK